MSLIKPKSEKDWIQKELKRIENHILKRDLTPEELKKELYNYQTLKSMINSIDINEVLKIGAGIFMLWMILRYERTDTITSKGFGIFTKFIGR